ncbi:MAG: tyrosine-protein phosphatase [Armatimonadetes bacterium]|nr:tyrosine-protein phosphatase [Armatimonadota bacterium]
MEPITRVGNKRSLPTPRPAALRDTGPVDGYSPGFQLEKPSRRTFEGMEAELKDRLWDLADRVRELPAADEKTRTVLEKIETLSAELKSFNTVEIKYELRKAIYELRLALEAGPPGGISREVKVALEKARTAALDISWEAQMRRPPSQRYDIVPAPATSQIPNFDRVADGVFRSGQPDGDGTQWLMAHGFRSAIDLRGRDADSQENQWVLPEWGSIRRYRIPAEDFEPPTLEQMAEFIRLVEDPANRPLVYHCKAGIGRTGVMTACWRVTQGFTADEAIAMEQIHSYNGTLTQEDFVRRFEAAWKEGRVSLGASRAAP